MQRFRKLALFISAVSATSAGLVVVACGTDNGTTPTPPTVDSGHSSSGSSGTSGTSGTSGGEGDTGTPDAGADCEGAPVLRTNTTAGGFFCAFYKSDAGAGGLASASNCASTDTCCNPGKPDGGTAFPPSFCAAGKVTDDGCRDQAATFSSTYEEGFFSSHWQCNDKTACPAATPVCVMVDAKNITPPTDHVNVGNDTKAPAACHELKAFKAGGTECVATQPAGTILICSSDADCSSVPGTTCKAFDGASRDLGGCLAP